MKKVLFSLCAAAAVCALIFAGVPHASAAAETQTYEVTAQNYFEGTYAHFYSPRLVAAASGFLFAADTGDNGESSVIYRFDMSGESAPISLELDFLPVKMAAAASSLFLLGEDGTKLSRWSFEGETPTFEENAPLPAGFEFAAITDIFPIYGQPDALGAARTISAGGNTFYDIARLDFSGVQPSFTALRTAGAHEYGYAAAGGRVYYLSDADGDTSIYSSDESSSASVAAAVLTSRPLQLSADGGKLYALTGDALQSYILDGTQARLESELEFEGLTAYKSGALSSPSSIYAADGKVYAADTDMRSVSALITDGGWFAAAQPQLFSAGESRAVLPVHVSAGTHTLVLDAGGGRIISGEKSIYLPAGYGARLACADGGGVLYISDGHTLQKGGADGQFEPVSLPADFDEEITALAQGNAGGVLALAGQSLLLADGDGAEIIAEVPAGALWVFASAKTSLFYVLLPGSVSVYSIGQDKELQLSHSLDLPAGFEPVCAETDFGGNLYVLGAPGLLRISGDEEALLLDIDSIAHFFLPDLKFDSFTIDRASGGIVLVSAAARFVGRIEKEQALTVSASDPLPESVEFSGSYGGAQVQEFEGIGIVKRFPSDMLYCPDSRLPERLEPGTALVLLERTGEYYYALYGDKTGFVLGYGLELLPLSGADDASLPPVPESAYPLWEDTQLFTLPSAARNAGGGFIYGLSTAQRSERLEIAARMRLSDGALWYMLSVDGLPAFVPAHALGQSIDTTARIYTFLVVSAGGGAPLCSDTDDGTEFARIDSGARLKLLESLDGWHKVEAYADGQAVTAYIRAEYTVPDGLTAAQKTGIIMLGSLAVLGVITLFVRKKFSR